MDENMDVMIVFPEFEDLKKEVEKLKTELSMLVLERDELLFVKCKNIEMSYMLELGALEYKAFEAQCTFLRLKRKLELLQAKRNRQEKANVAEIDAQLDLEFAEYKAKLDEQVHKMNEALDRSKCKTLTEDESVELKKLYRRVVKALHPDMNPGEAAEKIELFHRAVDAYKNGDLQTLRIIEVMSSDIPDPELHEDAMMSLVKEHDRLKGMIDGVKEDIERIKTSYPYTLQAILQDEEQMKARKADLDDTIEQYKTLIALYDTKIKALMEDSHG